MIIVIIVIMMMVITDSAVVSFASDNKPDYIITDAN